MNLSPLPQIEPHEGRELELLLNDSKQIALFFLIMGN